MIQVNNYIIFLILFFLLASCQEKYEPEDIISDKLIPVIEASITDDAACQVRLSWASKYNNSNIEYITGAMVVISDDAGNIELLSGKNGIYTSSSGVKGVPGRTYKLYVRLSKTMEFESEPERMNFGFKLTDSVYAAIENHVVTDQNSDGTVNMVDNYGINIYTNLSVDTTAPLYLQISLGLSTETKCDLGDFGGLCRVFSTTLYDIPNVVATYASNSKQLSNKHSLNFLSVFESEKRTIDPYGSVIFNLESWIVTTNYYSISAMTYKHFDAINNQLTAKEVMFDPIASQVKSNFHSLGDSNQLVLGYFVVASKVKTSQDAFYYSGKYSTRYWQKKIEPIMYIPRDSTNFIVEREDLPSYWISF